MRDPFKVTSWVFLSKTRNNPWQARTIRQQYASPLRRTRALNLETVKDKPMNSGTQVLPEPLNYREIQVRIQDETKRRPLRANS